MKEPIAFEVANFLYIDGSLGCGRSWMGMKEGRLRERQEVMRDEVMEVRSYESECEGVGFSSPVW